MVENNTVEIGVFYLFSATLSTIKNQTTVGLLSLNNIIIIILNNIIIIIILNNMFILFI